MSHKMSDDSLFSFLLTKHSEILERTSIGSVVQGPHLGQGNRLGNQNSYSLDFSREHFSPIGVNHPLLLKSQVALMGDPKVFHLVAVDQDKLKNSLKSILGSNPNFEHFQFTLTHDPSFLNTSFVKASALQGPKNLTTDLWEQDLTLKSFKAFYCIEYFSQLDNFVLELPTGLYLVGSKTVNLSGHKVRYGQYQISMTMLAYLFHADLIGPNSRFERLHSKLQETFHSLIGLNLHVSFNKSKEEITDYFHTSGIHFELTQSLEGYFCIPLSCLDEDLDYLAECILRFQ